MNIVLLDLVNMCAGLLEIISVGCMLLELFNTRIYDIIMYRYLFSMMG
jgi:hypothetical protein